MKRLKTVYSNSAQVFHLWANQSQSSARQGGRITRAFFRDTSCYSYGSHYEVGRIVTYKGIKVGLVNANKNSHTTNKHRSEAFNALDGLMPRLYAYNFSNVKQALLDTQGELVARIMNQFNTRTAWRIVTDLNDYFWGLEEFNKTAKALGHSELVIELPEEFISVLNEYLADRVAWTNDRDKEKRLKRELEAKQREIEGAARLERWLKGEDVKGYIRTNRLDGQLIRVKNNTVQTTDGAEVPLSQAIQALKAIELSEAHPGMQIGGFAFTKIDNNGIVHIGCHRIRLSHAKQVLKDYIK